MLRCRFALVLTGAVLLPAAAAVAAPAPISAIATQTSHKTAGKTQSFTETLRVSGKVIGTNKITCVLQSQTVAKCSAVFTLSKGQITVFGMIHYDKAVQALAISGGTGSYKNAKGTLTLKFGASSKTAETFKFI